MTARNRLTAATAVLLISLIVAGAAVIVGRAFFGPKTIIATFVTARGIYPGDDVRVLGVKVGTIKAIQAEPTQVKLTLSIDRDVPVPADAKAVIVAQNLVAARYVQLTPAYAGGPAMGDTAVIPEERTKVPVEWDEVKTQLMRLATDLGPSSTTSTTSVARFIDSTAHALGGNGDKLRQTIAQLSQVGRIIADGGGNIVDIIKNLQTFVSALRDTAPQIASLQNRLAALTDVLNGGRSDLDAALANLSTAVGEVQRFIRGVRDPAAEQIARLADVTQNLVDHKLDIENILHVAPNAFANGYNIYNPDTGSAIGSFVFNNFSNPVHLFCNAIGALENVTASETGKLCAEYLGPALRLFNFGYLPVPLNPYLAKSASPENIRYSEPGLAPGGAGPKPGPPEMPPAISAYTGQNGDVPPPAGYGQPPAVGPGPSAPDHLPATPSPALYPGAPIPLAPQSWQDMVLPAGPPPAPVDPQATPPPPAAGPPGS
jgi:virulence factor Mce-like protein